MGRISSISYVDQDLLPQFPNRIEIREFARRHAGHDIQHYLESLPYRKTPIAVGISLKTNSLQEVSAIAFAFESCTLTVALGETSTTGLYDKPLLDFLSGKPFPSKRGEDYTNTFVLLSFDMARNVLLIRKHIGHHARGIDLGILLAPNALAPWTPGRVVHCRLMQDADQRRINNYWDQEDGKSFHLRAWLCQRIGERCPQDVAAAVPVDTAHLSVPELECLEAMVSEAHQLDQLKPRDMKNEFTSLSIRKDGNLELVNDRYKSRVRRSSRQNVVMTTSSGRQHIVRAIGVNGRKTTLGSLGLANVHSITDIRVIGRQELTNSERAGEFLLLCALQGTKSFQKSPFIRLFWFPKWKKFKPPQDSTQLKQAHVEIVIQNAQLNHSQRKVVETVSSDERAIIVHGPPGTGKTTTIAAISRIWDLHDCPVWIVAHSNVAVKNIANALFKRDVNFKIIVSKEFYLEWHEHLYGEIEAKLIRSDELPSDEASVSRVIGDTCIILSTLSMLSNPALDQNGLFNLVPVERLIVDEASQIRIFEFLPLFEKFQRDLEKIYFFGDPHQLAPFNHEKVRTMKTVFDLLHLKRLLLNTQYRMPVALGDFISQEIYQSKLFSEHEDRSFDCVRFVHTRGSESSSGKSWINEDEISTAINIVDKYYQGRNFAVITPYDAQRGKIETALKGRNLPWEDRVFNLDSFQGNERDYIIISLVRTNQVGFLSNLNRLNVLLTRCKKGMVIVTNRNFLSDVGSRILVARFASYWKYKNGEERTWVDWSAIAYGSADLPGALGPNRAVVNSQVGYSPSLNLNTRYSHSHSASTYTSRVPSKYQSPSGGFDISRLFSKPRSTPVGPVFPRSPADPWHIDTSTLGDSSTYDDFEWPSSPSTAIESPPRTPPPDFLSYYFPPLPKSKVLASQQMDSSWKNHSLFGRPPIQNLSLRKPAVTHAYSVHQPHQSCSRGYDYKKDITTTSWNARSTRTQHSPPAPATTITSVNNQGYPRISSVVGSNASFDFGNLPKSAPARTLNPKATPFQSNTVSHGTRPGPGTRSSLPNAGFTDPWDTPATGPSDGGWTRVERRQGLGRKTFAEVAKAPTVKKSSNQTRNNRYWMARE